VKICQTRVPYQTHFLPSIVTHSRLNVSTTREGPRMNRYEHVPVLAFFSELTQ